MYFEKAEVKEYFRKNSKGNKIAYYQIRLKKDSKFNGVKTIALVDISELEKIVEVNDNDNFIELEAKYNNVIEENLLLKQELNHLKHTYENVLSEVNVLKEENINEKEKYSNLISETNSKIEEANDNIFEAKEKIEELQKEHKKELIELNSKLNNEKDFSKALLIAINDLNKRSFFNRLFNKEPSSVKKVLELKPKEFIVNDNSSEK